MTRIAALLASITLVLMAVAMSPANARPLLDHRHHEDEGSCARVLVGSLGACDFPNLTVWHPHYKRCYSRVFRENHPVRCERWLERQRMSAVGSSLRRKRPAAPHGRGTTDLDSLTGGVNP
jgi:hypothetical protein